MALARHRYARQRSPSKGWGYLRERDGAWVAHARIPGTGEGRARYIARTFPLEQKTEAEAWAIAENARLIVEGKDKPKPSRTSFQETADAFMDSLKLAKASAGHTTQMQRAIDQAVAFGITDLGAPDLIDRTVKLLIGLKTRGSKPASDSSRNNLLKHLRTLGNFAVRRDRVVVNPFLKIDKIPVTIDLKEVFTIDEVRKILAPANAAHPFYRAFASMIYTGFRLREMVNMDWSWFMWDAERLRMVIDKKERARVDLNAVKAFVPKNKRLRITRLMAEYADIMRPTGPVIPMCGPVFGFASRSNKSLQTTDKGFNGLLEAAGVPVRGRTPHSCRHTWTCLMLASGENEMLVKQYAGHSEKEMTEHYAQSQEEFRVQVAREGWAKGELSLIAAPKKSIATTATVSPVARPAN
jgi:integrase